MIDRKTNLDKLSKQIRKIEGQAASLQAKSFALRVKREELIAELILDEGVLLNTTWELKINNDRSIRLVYNRLDDSQMEIILNLSKSDQNSWFELQDGITLSFYDNDILITFKESKQAMSFVKRFNIKIISNGLTGHLAKLKRDVASLEEAVHKFNL